MTPFEIVQLIVRILLAAIFIGMGVAHFRRGPRRTMAKMIPPRMRRRGALRPEVLVAITGVCEIAGGIGLLVPATRVPAAVLLAVFLVAVFPANAYAARHGETFGRLATPLVPRLIGQLALIALCVVAAL
ncbi:DoxX family membrane protein [Leifsonia sp. NPDC058292]|uniref:DoxX family protein n=1 Tax=Leifsonia sp. NPDC058292 TaxID=3346428 RepID=UPI0036D948DD